MSKVLSIVWSQEAFISLREIHEYYFRLNPAAADRIREEVVSAVSNLKYTKQYQLDEFNPDYRRLIVRHYKVFYKIKGQEIRVLEIFDTRQNPNKSQYE